MAKRNTADTAQSAQDMKAMLQAQDEELVELRAIVARTDHMAIVNRLPGVTADYAPELCNKVIALGAIGLSPDETRTELGLSEDDWKGWKARYPAFEAATSRARSLAKAYWFRKGRVAMETHNWKFNIDRLPKIMAMMFSEDNQELGNASELVVLDVNA